MDLKTLNMLNAITVLVVEDDEMVRVSIVQSLEPYCKKVYVAKDGLEGLELFKKSFVDVVITDINMPELNGFEMIREILKIKPTQEFIVMTSYDSDENLLASIEEGACSYLRKPLKIEELQTNLLILAKKNFIKCVKLSDEIEVDKIKNMVFKYGKELLFSPTQNRIFWLLFNNLNRVVPYDVIVDYVYDNEDISKSTIRMAILRLSEVIGKDRIENVSGIGYRLKGA